MDAHAFPSRNSHKAFLHHLLKKRFLRLRTIPIKDAAWWAFGRRYFQPKICHCPAGFLYSQRHNLEAVDRRNSECVYQIEAVVAHQKWPKMIDNCLCASQKSHKKFCVSFCVESDEQNCVSLVTHNPT